MFSIARIGQVQVIFRARFRHEPSYSAGPESLDVALFAWNEIPWDEIAFPSVRWALDAWRRDGGAAVMGAPAGNPADDRRGVHPMIPPRALGAEDGL